LKTRKKTNPKSPTKVKTLKKRTLGNLKTRRTPSSSYPKQTRRSRRENGSTTPDSTVTL